MLAEAIEYCVKRYGNRQTIGYNEFVIEGRLFVVAVSVVGLGVIFLAHIKKISKPSTLRYYR